MKQLFTRAGALALAALLQVLGAPVGTKVSPQE